MRRFGLAFMLVSALLHSSVSAAPKAELWRYWLPFAQQPTVTVDHSPWQHYLQRRVDVGDDGIARVDYAGTTPAERQGITAYLAQMQRVPVANLTRHQQRAYWINLYNAGTLAVVLEHYPVRSIRDIDTSPGLFADGPWGEKLFTITGQQVSLDDIEHRILRPIWRDNRLHYALNCASIGCPNLQRIAFTARNGEQLLETAAKTFVNHPRAVRVEDGKLYVSSIYKWFAEDFGDQEQAIVNHLRKYAEPALEAQLAGFTEIEDYAYDWALNAAR